MSPRRRDPDAAILEEVVGTKDFLHSALVDDSLRDWHLAVELGRLLVRIEPKEILGHALLARAYRHLGDRRSAHELMECRKRLRQRRLARGIRQLFRPFLSEEAQHR